jgi:hypothetical protein
MNKLLRHISEDNLGTPFWDETLQQSDYGHLIAYVYVIIKRALNEGADRIKFTARSYSWSQQGKVICEHDFDPTGSPDYPKSWKQEFRKIRDKDPIVKKWTRVVSDENETIVCEFLS